MRVERPLDRLAAHIDKERMDYDVQAAKVHLCKLLANALMGEDVVITEAGEPIARIVAIRSLRTRQSGTEKGKFWIAADFNAPLSEDLCDLFERKS